jgi:hypothetical protein
MLQVSHFFSMKKKQQLSSLFFSLHFYTRNMCNNSARITKAVTFYFLFTRDRSASEESANGMLRCGTHQGFRILSRNHGWRRMDRWNDVRMGDAARIIKWVSCPRLPHNFTVPMLEGDRFNLNTFSHGSNSFSLSLCLVDWNLMRFDLVRCSSFWFAFLAKNAAAASYSL